MMIAHFENSSFEEKSTYFETKKHIKIIIKYY